MLKTKKGAKIAAIAAAAFMFSASAEANTSCPENNSAKMGNDSATHCVDNNSNTVSSHQTTHIKSKTEEHNKCGGNGCGGKNQCSSNGCAGKK